ncbi:MULTISPECIES: hypothetical protein [unclassified Bacillus (in: firmicutes)]|uniref:hypothetical protein n=1 Tax=unclassified Bacillus (in: firmicutes) TaxID=185979 RepID=UPI0008F23051|nr:MULTISPECIES: hypothetical protein [unclassified Bacillus (in: firmicutes)]SFB08033.1 hypothetical protein SAMN02799634_105144 [Bacillus sp. UNCCL13]SFQ87160.1 hypothetical protein SAMN04488577_2977 [Bacillus sp. cl95]
MQDIEWKELQILVSSRVEISIHDAQNEDQAPIITKIIYKVELCPDGTHVRIHFDKKNFFAVPLTSNFTQTDREWRATDTQSGLSYVIREI